MDTSDLASSLSLSACLLIFGYFSLVEHALSPRVLHGLPPERLIRSVNALQILRLTTVVAAVLSCQALLLSRSPPSLLLNAIVALDLLAILVVIDGTARHLSARFPGIGSGLASPLYVPLSRFLGPQRQGAISDAPGINGNEHAGEASDTGDSPSVVITEEEQETLDARERLMIRSILRLDESTVREVMVPRVDLVALEGDTPIKEAAVLMLESGHSRLPVYSGSIDNIIGVIYSRDLLPFLGQADEYPPLEKVMRPAFFIPESKRLDELLLELQEKRIQMAIVIDEYGGVEGLVTLEDLLEEIVGEIEDEFSGRPEPWVVPMADGQSIVDARVSLDSVSDLFSISIGNKDIDTIGGLVYSALGKMPQVGDEVVHNGLRIEVVSLVGRRIRKLKLGRAEVSDAQDR